MLFKVISSIHAGSESPVTLYFWIDQVVEEKELTRPQA